MLDILNRKTEPEFSGIKRIIDKFIPPKVTSVQKNCRNAAYNYITAYRRGGKIDWRMVCSNSVNTSGRILVPLGESLPPSGELFRFAPSAFLRRLQENFALELLSMLAIPAASRSIALYGQEAELIALLPKLVPITGEVKIITRRAYAVRECAEDLSRQTGMPITVIDRMDASGCNILLCPSGGARAILSKDVDVVISPDKPLLDSSIWVHTLDFEFPQFLTEIYTQSYDKTEFAAAFYELSGIIELSRIIPHKAFTSCGCHSAKSLSEQLSLQKTAAI